MEKKIATAKVLYLHVYVKKDTQRAMTNSIKSNNKNTNIPSEYSMNKVNYTLKQFVRDWSKEVSFILFHALNVVVIMLCGFVGRRRKKYLLRYYY